MALARCNFFASVRDNPEDQTNRRLCRLIRTGNALVLLTRPGIREKWFFWETVDE
jgi:hypothetical protein